MYKIAVPVMLIVETGSVNCGEHALNRVRKFMRENELVSVGFRGPYKRDGLGLYDAFHILDEAIDSGQFGEGGSDLIVEGPSFSAHDKRKAMKALTEVGFSDDEIDRIFDVGVGD